MTGETILKGKIDIQHLVQFNSGVSVDIYIRPGNKKFLVEVKKGQIFWINKTIGMDDASYIITVGRKAP